jgi:hypothetical protein
VDCVFGTKYSDRASRGEGQYKEGFTERLRALRLRASGRDKSHGSVEAKHEPLPRRLACGQIHTALPQPSQRSNALSPDRMQHEPKNRGEPKL